jgi:hypothetical protein
MDDLQQLQFQQQQRQQLQLMQPPPPPPQQNASPLLNFANSIFGVTNGDTNAQQPGGTTPKSNFSFGSKFFDNTTDPTWTAAAALITLHNTTN